MQNWIKALRWGNEPATRKPAAEESGAPASAIRKLWIGESKLFRDHLLRLDPESRRSRFGSPVNEYFITDYAGRALGPDSVIHGFFVAGTLRAAAELRPFGNRFPYEAEAAFSVELDWQNCGIGTVLFERTILAARNRGIRTLYMSCLAENRRMQRVARKYKAEIRFDADDVIGEVANPGPTPLSLFREFIADGHDFATAILDVHSRMFRTV
jgi:GNAT superfamily N-acetyltransferase